MRVKIRYVTKRPNDNGSERWYWQRPGHALTRLPDNPIERLTMAERLNAAADAGGEVEHGQGTIGWVVKKYRESDDYAELRPGTVKYYKRYLRDIEDLGPGLPFASFTRKAVVDFLETYPKRHQRRQCAAVLKNLFNIATYHSLTTKSAVEDLRLKGTPKRTRLWTDEEIARWIKAAESEDPHMVTAFRILQYSAQRPSDMLAMARPQYNGATIQLRQEKTGQLLDVPCHPALKEHLDSLPPTMMLVTYRGRPVKYLRFNERFRRTCQRAGVDAQARDLRRTAMVNMALAGATVPQIASVSGHSIDETQKIIDTYIPKNRDLAAIAISRLADHKKNEKSNAGLTSGS